MKILQALIVSFAILTGLSSCANYDFTHTKVQQGNLLPEHAIAHLKIGMSKEEVAAVLGNSLLTNTFSDNYWDYAYTSRIGGGAIIKKHVIITFTNDRVSAISQH